jgi:hypothetical protein
MKCTEHTHVVMIRQISPEMLFTKDPLPHIEHVVPTQHHWKWQITIVVGTTGR